LLDAFGKACDATMDAIRAMLPEPAAEPAASTVPMAPAPDAPASLQVMQELAGLLAAGDADAIDFFAVHRAGLRIVLREQFGAIERAIGDFDFEKALEMLRATAKEI
jgi:hypothetical protein